MEVLVVVRFVLIKQMLVGSLIKNHKENINWTEKMMS
jgi:hypothetical protein